MGRVNPALDRRSLLLIAGASLLAGCTGASTGKPSPSGAAPSAPSVASPTGTSTSSTAGVATTTAPGTSAPSTSAPAARPVWTASPQDVSPEVKQTATGYVESQIHPDVEVVFAQYGGILSTTASVLVVTHPWPTVSDPAAGTTYDVRLVKKGSTWSVTEVHPSDPGAPSRTVSTAARQVLSLEQIDLSPAARADIASGQVHDSVLTAMLTLAGTYRLGVSVVRSGHPLDVFGTSRPSDHPVGRAFDTWRIDDQPVVAASTPRALVTAYMRAAASLGSYNVGGPVLPSGSQFFSDATHHDHVHIGFRS